MTGDLAAGARAQCLVADAGAHGGERGRRAVRVSVGVAPLRIPAWVLYSKGDVFGLCDTLARAERVLIGAGETEEAARVAAAFDVLEAGLA
jgi:hypothetical protein